MESGQGGIRQRYNEGQEVKREIKDGIVAGAASEPTKGVALACTCRQLLHRP